MRNSIKQHLRTFLLAGMGVGFACLPLSARNFSNTSSGQDMPVVSSDWEDGVAPVNKLAKRVLTGYWENWVNKKVLKLKDIPLEYNLVCISFGLQTTTPGEVSFTLDNAIYPTADEFIKDVAALKARGQRVILSVGGATGAIKVENDAAADAFTKSVNKLMDKYGFEGVDIDFENGVNPTYMAKALKGIKAGSIITMAPETVYMQKTSNNYFSLALAIKDILTICNMQYYNSGTMYGQDGKIYKEGTKDFLTALAAIQLENGLRPDQVGLGVPATKKSASGYVEPSVIAAALDCLISNQGCDKYKPVRTYPDFRGVMTWSIQEDQVNNFALAKAVGAKLKSLP